MPGRMQYWRGSTGSSDGCQAWARQAARCRQMWDQGISHLPAAVPQVNRLLVVGRDSVHQVAERFL